jgi:hypothetical protein
MPNGRARSMWAVLGSVVAFKSAQNARRTRHSAPPRISPRSAFEMLMGGLAREQTTKLSQQHSALARHVRRYVDPNDPSIIYVQQPSLSSVPIATPVEQVASLRLGAGLGWHGSVHDARAGLSCSGARTCSDARSKLVLAGDAAAVPSIPSSFDATVRFSVRRERGLVQSRPIRLEGRVAGSDCRRVQKAVSRTKAPLGDVPRGTKARRESLRTTTPREPVGGNAGSGLPGEHIRQRSQRLRERLVEDKQAAAVETTLSDATLSQCTLSWIKAGSAGHTRCQWLRPWTLQG